MSRFARQLTRHQLRATIATSAKAKGCRCTPDIELPGDLKAGALRVITVHHDDDCPLANHSVLGHELKTRINHGEFDDGASRALVQTNDCARLRP